MHPKQQITIFSVCRRYMFGLSVIPAVLQGIGMFFMPPSPRFLFMTGKPAEVSILFITITQQLILLYFVTFSHS